jgi:hypothetical protein
MNAASPGSVDRLRIAIRDDDTCFYTKPAELAQLYETLWDRIPVSLSVVPNSVPAHRWHRFKTDARDDECRWLHLNKELVSFLREKIREGRIEVMLHGFTHEFRRSGGSWLPECLWKTPERLMEEVLQGKTYLEDLLESPVRVFVPPGNAIAAAGILAIESAGLDLSGILGRRVDRPLSAAYAAAYFRRWAYRARNGAPYPFPLRVGKHWELTAHALTPRSNPDSLRRSLQRACEIGAPFVLATHYWEVGSVSGLSDTFRALVNEALSLGAVPSTVSECLRSTCAFSS